jgi:hypothetical protein
MGEDVEHEGEVGAGQIDHSGRFGITPLLQDKV